MKSKMFPILSSPAKIGNVTLKNRILKAPQSSGMNNKDGTVSERAIRYYSDQAKGGAGAIIVEYAYVDEIGSKSAHCHLGISSDEHIPGLSWLAECIRENGAVPAIQIEHCGRQKFLGTQPICAASALPWPHRSVRRQPGKPHAHLPGNRPRRAQEGRPGHGRHHPPERHGLRAGRLPD